MVIELRVLQFWSEIILVISNRTRAARSFDFEITRMISDQIALHSVQLPLLILDGNVQRSVWRICTWIFILGFKAGLSIRAGGQGFSPTIKKVAPGYFYWKIEQK